MNMGVNDVFSGLVILALLVLFSLFFAFVNDQGIPRLRGGWCFGFLVLALGLSSVEWLWLQRIVLVGILALYVGPVVAQHLPSSSRKLSLHAGLALHMMVSWGPWATVASMTLLMALPVVVRSLRLPEHRQGSWRQQPDVMVAWMVLPWVVWILWWTLMGQVNGVQFCYEGLCPHPRELDPGLVRVQGGYFGGGAQPSTLWMAMMVVSPLLTMSVAMMHCLISEGVDLRPYVIAQVLIVFGCLALYAYTPIYPRLVFSLTYNMLFASAQICFALLALGWSRFTQEIERRQRTGEGRGVLRPSKFRVHETI